ncbi:MAG: P-type conjugative transfer ATPase TrbB [Deltaproteobacteria bacterium]|nr:P-type conjugative transfer ATPase TrbB [Deltaproteobacteria bacterium]
MSNYSKNSPETLLESLSFNIGETILKALDDPTVLEIMVNPDMKLWIERFGQPMQRVFADGTVAESKEDVDKPGDIEPDRTRSVITLVASALDSVATVDRPIVEGELPLDGSRFEGVFPPVVSNPMFSIRKKASKVFSLDEYVQAGIMPESVADIISYSILAKDNILVVGGTGSGKTTLVNGIIHKLSELCPEDRLAIIEDTVELQVSSANITPLRTTLHISANTLLRACLRLRPDRIFLGEIRGGEYVIMPNGEDRYNPGPALSLLNAWNTGHPGGIATIHANSALDGLLKLKQYAMETSADAALEPLIGSTVNLALFIAKTPEGRRLKQAVKILGWNNNTQQYDYEVLYEV